MKCTPTAIPEVMVLEPAFFEDARGFFFESFNQAVFERVTGSPGAFVQDNDSFSAHAVLRGLHYQLGHPQGKLVRVVHGTVFDVAVDLRRSSPTFGKWVADELSAANRKQMWVPGGFAHGFLVLSEHAEVLYKTTDYYDPTSERSIAWNDPTLAIEWPLARLTGSPRLSAKDAAAGSFRAADTYE